MCHYADGGGFWKTASLMWKRRKRAVCGSWHGKCHSGVTSITGTCFLEFFALCAVVSICKNCKIIRGALDMKSHNSPLQVLPLVRSRCLGGDSFSLKLKFISNGFDSAKLPRYLIYHSNLLETTFTHVGLRVVNYLCTYEARLYFYTYMRDTSLFYCMLLECNLFRRTLEISDDWRMPAKCNKL